MGRLIRMRWMEWANSFSAAADLMTPDALLREGDGPLPRLPDLLLWHGAEPGIEMRRADARVTKRGSATSQGGIRAQGEEDIQDRCDPVLPLRF